MSIVNGAVPYLFEHNGRAFPFLGAGVVRIDAWGDLA